MQQGLHEKHRGVYVTFQQFKGNQRAIQLLPSGPAQRICQCLRRCLRPLKRLEKKWRQRACVQGLVQGSSRLYNLYNPFFIKQFVQFRRKEAYPFSWWSSGTVRIMQTMWRFGQIHTLQQKLLGGNFRVWSCQEYAQTKRRTKTGNTSKCQAFVPPVRSPPLSSAKVSSGLSPAAEWKCGERWNFTTSIWTWPTDSWQCPLRMLCRWLHLIGVLAP